MKKQFYFGIMAISLLALVAGGCRKIEMDGDKEIIIINGGGGGGNTGQTITVSGRINADTIFRKQNTYVLKGLVYIVGNHTITIEEGTVIKGSYSGADVAGLVITRGSKIVAKGTPIEPIVFTSASPNPASGDWAGIVILGSASINTAYNGINGLFQAEGGIDNSFGDGLAGSGDAAYPAPNDNDSSGVLQYVRIEYAGYAFQPDKEINSLTMAGVGRKTVIDHVQVTYAKDDAYEWFGGTVNCKYLIAYKTQDDDFDTDNGWSGQVQFGLIVRDSLVADISRSEGMESDNNSSGSTVAPQTRGVFSNLTVLGPRAALTNIGNPLYLAGAQIRRNSSISIFNSAFLGWPIGVLIDAKLGRPTDLNISDSNLRIQNTIIAGCNVPVQYDASTSAPTGSTTASMQAWFLNPFYGNSILATVEDVRLTRPFDYDSPDFQPFGTSPLNTGANFTHPKLTGGQGNNTVSAVTFRGAIAPGGGADANWHKGWTRFDN
jgi:hypothetical protein